MLARKLISITGILSWLFILTFLVGCCAKKIPNLPQKRLSVERVDKVFNGFPFEAFFHVRLIPVEKEEKPEGIPPDLYELIKSQSISSGSGALIDTDSKFARVISAAHVCVPGIYSEKPMLFDYRIELLTWKGDKYAGEILAIDATNDTCIIGIEALEDDFPVAIPIADEDPRIGEKAYMAASPLGIYVPGMPLLFEGYYGGIDNDGDQFYTIPVAPGSSGAAIVNNEGELVGMCKAGVMEFHHILISSSWKDVRYLLETIK